ADTFVAHFVGDLNYFEGRYSRGANGSAGVETERGMTISVQQGAHDAPGALVGCGIRPEKLQVGTGHAPHDNQFNAKVRMLTFRGSHYWADLLLPSGEGLIAMLPETSRIGEGAEVAVGWNADEVRVFSVHARRREAQLTK